MKTDDALPDKPISFDVNKVLADIKTKRAAQSSQPLRAEKLAPKTKLIQKKTTKSGKSIQAESKVTSALKSKSTVLPASQVSPSQTKPKNANFSISTAQRIAQSQMGTTSENKEANVQSSQAPVDETVTTEETPMSELEDSTSASEKH